MIHTQQLGQLGRNQRFGYGPDLIRLQFNAPSGYTTYPDSGSAGSVWSDGGGSMAISTLSTPPEGGSWLLLNTNAVTLSTPYVAGNAITGGDFFIGGYFRPSGIIASRYMISVQDATGTVAGTAWGFFVASAGLLHIIICDGTTRTVHSTGITLVADTTYYIAMERVGNTIYPSVGGVVGTTLAFAGSVNLPSGRSINLGAAEAGNAPDGMYVDLLQIRRASVFGGAGFTIPTTPIP